MTLKNIIIGETLGTFLLATAVMNGANPFIAVFIMILLLGGMSGAHFNPVATLTLALQKKIENNRILFYLLSQFSGVVLAFYINNFIHQSDNSFNFSSFSSHLMVAEVLGGFVFASAIRLASKYKLKDIPMAVAIAGGLYLAAQLGGIVNPMVSLVAIDINAASIVGPLIGAALSAIFIDDK